MYQIDRPAAGGIRDKTKGTDTVQQDADQLSLYLLQFHHLSPWICAGGEKMPAGGGKKRGPFERSPCAAVLEGVCCLAAVSKEEGGPRLRRGVSHPLFVPGGQTCEEGAVLPKAGAMAGAVPAVLHGVVLQGAAHMGAAGGGRG